MYASPEHLAQVSQICSRLWVGSSSGVAEVGGTEGQRNRRWPQSPWKVASGVSWLRLVSGYRFGCRFGDVGCDVSVSAAAVVGEGLKGLLVVAVK